MDSILNSLLRAQCVFRFDNGYGAHISRTPKSSLWDMEVIRFTDEPDRDCFEDVTYDMPFTDDILVDLTTDKVLEFLVEIRDLPEDYYIWT